MSLDVLSADNTTADRVRSELGPLVKALDQPHAHVLVTDGLCTLHGDVSDVTARAALEARALTVTGVRRVDSHLHVGLLPGDSTPSSGHIHQRSPLLRQLIRTARDRGFWSARESTRALGAVLGVFSWRLPHRVRERFLGHLPVDVRRLAQPPYWLDDDPRLICREHDFDQTVAFVMGVDPARAAELTRGVLPLLRRHAPEDGDAIARSLPPQLRAIWVEHPSVHRSVRRPACEERTVIRQV